MNITAQDALLVNSILYLFGFIIVLFIIIKYRKRLANLHSFGYYFLFNAIGAFLMYYRDVSPHYITIIIANYLIILGGMFMATGVSKFFNKKVPYKAFGVVSILTILGMSYFSYVDFSFASRTIIFGVFVLMIHFHILKILYDNRLENDSEIDLLSVMIIIFLLTMILRATILTFSEIPDTFFEINNFAPLNTILIGMSGALISAGVLSLINNRLLDEVKEAANTFSNVINNSPVPAMIHAENGEMLYISDEFIKITGYTLEDVSTIEKWIQVAYDSKRDKVRKIIHDLFEHKEDTNDNQIEVITKDKSIRIWSFHSGYIGKSTDGRNMAMSVATDVTESYQAESNLQFERDKAQKYLDIIGTMLIALDTDGNITLINNKGCKILEVEEKDALGKNWFDEFIPKEINQEIKEVFAAVFAKDIEMATQYENTVVTKSGKTRAINWYNSILYDIDGNITGVISSGEDVTEKRLYEDNLKEIGYRDALTGLYNRRFYEERLKELDNESNYPITIAMGDINGLKLINDAFGHDAGDELLKSAATVIKDTCRDTDLVARIGGDEFVIAMPKTSEKEAEIVIAYIHEKIKSIMVESIQLSISFGIKTKEFIEEDIQEIYRSAEDLMYREKLLEIPSMRSGAIETILNTLYEKDKNSEIHSRTVSLISEKLAKASGMSRQDTAETKTAGLLHDIGKIIISLSIINKEGKLTTSEYTTMKTHSEIGFRILNSTSNMRGISNIVLCHHERWDGAGYPRGIKGEKIPVKARIITIADAYDAMTSERTYRDIISKEDALKEIIANSGTQFDPKLVKVFKEHFEEIVKE